MVLVGAPWTQDLGWNNMRRPEDVMDVFWAPHAR